MRLQISIKLKNFLARNGRLLVLLAIIFSSTTLLLHISKSTRETDSDLFQRTSNSRIVSRNTIRHSYYMNLSRTVISTPSKHGSSEIKGHQYNYNFKFHRNRIRLWNQGRCIDSVDGSNVMVSYCDPDIPQTFSLTADNKLVYDRTGQCVGYDDFKFNVTLILMNCDEITGQLFELRDMDDSYLQSVFSVVGTKSTSYLRTVEKIDNSEHLCITPITAGTMIRGQYGRSHEVGPESPCMNNSIGIARCQEVASALLLFDEEEFQEDRKLLRNLVIPANNPDCDFKACGLNSRTPRIKELSPNQISRCIKPWECVTLVVKTAKRPLLVLRLAQSVREVYGFDLPIAVCDDGPDDYSVEVKQQFAQFPLLNYVIGEDDDYGIAEGRNRALSLVKTKYFFLMDDDVLFLNSTDMQTMIDILDTTDATLVGGELRGRGNFAGFIKLGYFQDSNKRRRMGLFPGTCDKLNQTVPNFPHCVQCDLNTNIFMARTEHIKGIGGWDPELKVLEHKDLFLKMKAVGLKVAVCHRIQLRHDPPNGPDETELQAEGYFLKRRRNYSRYRGLLENRYNIQGVFQMYKQDITEEGEVMFYNKTGKASFC